MKARWMKKAVVAGVALMLLSGTAMAGNALPKSRVVLESDQVTLGDVFSGVTQSAGHVLAPAPAPGRDLILSSGDLQRISNAFHLGWKPLQGDEKTVISSVMTTIGLGDIRQALEKTLAERFPERKFDIDLPPSSYPIVLAGKFASKPEVTSLDYDPARGSFNASLLVQSTGQKKDFTAEISGKLFKLIEVPVLSGNLRAGSIIKESDITYVTMRDGDVGQNTLLDAAELTGQTPRRGVVALKPLQGADITTPNTIEKGALVTVILKKGKLSLSVKGKALEAGADGATIRVLNTSSNKTVEAKITGPETVSVVM